MIGDSKINIIKITEDIYLLDEDNEATGYLVVGRHKALLIDTMNAHNDLKAVVRTITDKPVMVVNTHGHGDHIFGNMFFDEAYISPEDIPLAKMFTDQAAFEELLKKNGKTMPPFKDIRGGDVIDLGGRTADVYDIPGHTPGSILLHLKEERILFVGDSINHHLWLQLDGCSPVSEYLKTLEDLLFLQDRADIILHGHAQSPDDISLMKCLVRGLREICDGKTDNDLPYEYFGGTARMHPFECIPGKNYSMQDHAIIYREDNV